MSGGLPLTLSFLNSVRTSWHSDGGSDGGGVAFRCTQKTKHRRLCHFEAVPGLCEFTSCSFKEKMEWIRRS